MVFSSISFLFFILPLFWITDGIGRLLKRNDWRNTSLIAVSLVFYIWGEATNVLLLIGMGLLNYYGGAYLARCTRQRLVTGLLVVVNLLTLFVFKYLGWVLSYFYTTGAPDISLPLGISFFTFHAVSYIIDISRKDIAPARGLNDFMAYFCMFPHLVAGPIVRFNQVQNELEKRADDPELFSFGMYRFLLGLNKKLLIANLVAPLADMAFSASVTNTFGNAWLGALAYAIQIYFDFSAYSDMAIGLAAMAGFRFEENFSRPYSATSIRDFWRRWHISLSSWLRDYLYIPLGGNRKGMARTLLNLLIVFFLCGLWHGANITFVIWGLWHGLFLVFERLALGVVLEKIPRPVGRLYAFFVVLIGWVFFRANDMDQALSYLGTMFVPDFGFTLTLTYSSKAMLGLIAGVILCLISDRLLPRPTSHSPEAFSKTAMLVQAVLFVPSLANLLVDSRNPFIYFNF